MFATSTKTATFLLTETPYVLRRRTGSPRRQPRSSCRGLLPDGTSDSRALIFESETLPAGPFRGIVRLRGLDRGAALVGSGPQRFLDERLRDVVGIGGRVDDQEVDRPDETAR